MASVKISEIALEIGCSSAEIIKKAQEMGLTSVKKADSSVNEKEAEAIYIYVQTGVISDELLAKKEKKAVAKKPKKDSKEESKPKEKSIPQNAQKPIETLASASLQKRRGLVIVKKKKEEQEEAPKISKEISKTKEESLKYLNLENAFSNSDANLDKKKKDKKKKVAVSKKESVQKVDLLGEMAEIVLEDDDMVVLPDLTTKEFTPTVNHQNKKQTNVLKQSFNKVLGEQSIQRKARKKHKKVEKKDNNEIITSINIPREIRVYEFADRLNKQPSEIISKLFMLGMMTTKNDFLDDDAIEILADEFGVEVNIVDTKESFDYVKAYEDVEIDKENGVSRTPVITIMGHVDHGKTSLLDYIRNSRVASGEAGGITQHVGAYMVNKDGRNITFIDTPGHEAFTAMRARGAQVTDIVIIVVAADDGVKPQTIEAINHAKSANVPIIIAINKMDKESANPDMVKSRLAELDVLPVEWGGKYEFVPISAKTGMGVEELLEVVLLQADILELKANPNRDAKAVIVESSLQKGRGPVATIIVENGTLNLGDTVVAGVAYGRVRSLSDDKGVKLKSIKPGECGVITGLSEVPEAGEALISVKSEKEAREYAQKKMEYLRQKELSKSTKVTIDELADKIKEGEIKSLPIIIKADVQGSLEAIKASLEKLRNEEVKVDIIHSGIGGITQSDIGLASASQNCVVLGFNIRPTGTIKEQAKERGVEIKTYNVIYSLIDDVKMLLSGLMSPILREEQLGQAEIRQVINVPKVGAIAGCMVTEGTINRGAKIRLIRDGVVVYEGNVSSLKRFKDDVKEVAKGYECGIGIDGYNDLRQGDYIESYKEIEEQVSI
ncbi:translation initiation factor IF-2 [Campylobacter sputorum subsp. sputorum]|uniref:Translation initiation factor IF-2 n=1 Tax=Campylobacter sputorum subsp. sputorum TaxID=32024 RepID=A0A381DKM1_9BACT|nr:translation initiation factor IF-2 [Campylobacter sputorum]KAB0582136.1 translation initiation factor IF-2 [Campylobacter sputorum subsp. sputorum]SUX11140.1 translation initiation factor IF-2 [Campylobacter sputorum subsp. sputorum]